MGTRLWRGVGVAGLLALAAVMASPEAMARSSRDKKKKEKEARYVVVRAKDTDGEITIDVLKYDAYRERSKNLAKDYKEAAQEWLAAAKDAKKNKETFDEPRPQKPYIVKVSKSSYKEKEDAEKFAERYEEAWEKKMEKYRKKKGIEDDGFKDDAKDEKETEKKKAKKKD